MKRGSFLRLLPAVPVGLLAAREVTTTVVEFRYPGYTSRYDVHGFPDGSNNIVLTEIIEHWSGGIRPLRARIDRLAQTGDAEKFTVTAQHPDGTWHSKPVLISGLVSSFGMSARASELAYSLSRKARELARDWAFLEWGDDWRSHVPPQRRP